MRKETEYQKELYRLGRKWVGPHGVELLTLVFDREELREARRRLDGELEVTIHLHMGRVDSVFAELPTGGFLKLKVNPNADTRTQTAAEHRRSLMGPPKTPEPFPYGRPASGGSLSLFPPKKGSD